MQARSVASQRHHHLTKMKSFVRLANEFIHFFRSYLLQKKIVRSEKDGKFATFSPAMQFVVAHFCNQKMRPRLINDTIIYSDNNSYRHPTVNLSRSKFSIKFGNFFIHCIRVYLSILVGNGKCHI